MVFNKQQSLAFICPTRTASTALHSYLSKNGWFRLREKHESLDKLIELYPNLYEYKIYGFFRDPLIRFESCVMFAKQSQLFPFLFQKRIVNAGIEKTVEEISYDEIVDCFNQLFDFGGFLFKPQTFWLNDARVTVLDFHNLQSELEKVIGQLSEPIPVVNKSTDFGRSVITDKVRAFVRDYYAADYQFAKDVLGKEY